MRLVSTREASILTGLSTHQLREWTSRRALIPADIKPSGHGSPAKYFWQTILLLRIAVILRERFRVELQANRNLFGSLRTKFRRSSFFELWDKSLIIYGGDRWRLADSFAADTLGEDAITVRLRPHLEVLAVGFALGRPPTASGQLELFPARLMPTPIGSTVRETEFSKRDFTRKERRGT
jgi:hypothetical protein